MGFNANKVKDDIVVWIRKMFEENGKGCNAVIGISGGKDSSVTAALCVAALGKDRVIGVLMPNGKQEDKNVAVELCNHLGINHIEINVKNAFDSILEQIDEIYISKVDSYIPISISDQTTINLPPRLRMATLYAVSQSVGGRVMNTCNLSEDYVGYATRYGDSAGDFAPLANLTSDEVIAVGAACGLPNSFIYKTPSDGLCGKTDEDNQFSRLMELHANHDRYVESVQKPFYSFIDDLMPTLLEIDPRMEPRPHKSLTLS